ncbi:hypothetical protein BD769DRAFT_508645 [Suillus cothurnatus]|nr:hypothetical protein BD769DRAFT_508645 [Suillus cothurnatus]
MDTGAALNPARDLGPRILTAMVGYGSAVFNFRNQYWLWCPVLGPIFGMLVAAFFYDAMLYRGSESIPTSRVKRLKGITCTRALAVTNFMGMQTQFNDLDDARNDRLVIRTCMC